MSHVDHLQNVARRHDNVVPASWLTGDTEYQKAKVIAAVSWHDIKEPADPAFLQCDFSFQERCIGIVESIMRGNMPDDSPFAQQAARRWKEVTAPPTKELDHG